MQFRYRCRFQRLSRCLSRCRTGVVLESDVGHGLANEEFGTFGTGRQVLDTNTQLV